MSKHVNQTPDTTSPILLRHLIFSWSIRTIVPLVMFMLTFCFVGPGLAQLNNSTRDLKPLLRETWRDVTSLLKPAQPLLEPRSFLDESPEIKTAQFTYGMLDGILPSIPNLQAGYLYSFGKDYSLGRFVGDIFVPLNLKWSDTFFGQGHVEFQDFWQVPGSFPQHRVDLSFGGGYRKLMNPNIMVGFNGFYDSTRILGQWWSAGGVGAEMAALLPNKDVVDLNFNYYGNLFRGPHYLDGELIAGPANMDFEAGYTTSLFDNSHDLRFKLNIYNYDVRYSVYGVRGGVDFKPWSGALILRYEVGRDQIYGSYETVGGFVNIPLNLDGFLTGKLPFVQAGGPVDDRRLGNGFHASPTPDGIYPTPLNTEPNPLRKLMDEPVHRQFASHAVSTESVEGSEPAPTTFVALGDAEVVFTLYPKYSAAMLNNIKPSTIQVSATVTSRGKVDITAMRLYIKDTGIVWSLPMPDWTIAMGNSYSYNLSPSEIDNLWSALSQSPDRTISEVRFNQLNGSNLQNLNISLTITQSVVSKKSTETK
ncbi:MAG: inverse autotransporter beta domain-containing protein [Desulfomonilaceae bacterium]